MHPKVLLSFGCSSQSFPRWGSTANSSCSCMETAWASFDFFGAMTFFLRIKTKKKKKHRKRAAGMDSHTSFIACGTAHRLTLPLTFGCRTADLEHHWFAIATDRISRLSQKVYRGLYIRKSIARCGRAESGKTSSQQPNVTT